MTEPADAHPDFTDDIPLELAERAHRGTSHTPDVRGMQEVEEYARILTADLADLTALADTEEKRAYLAETFPIYRDAYRLAKQALLSAKGRCVSTMIAGGSNFPVRRAQKASDSADKRAQEMLDCRVRWLKIIRKRLRPAEAGPIMSSDPQAAQLLAAEIAKLEQLQQRMREANALIRKHAKAGVPAQLAAAAAPRRGPAHPGAARDGPAGHRRPAGGQPAR